MTSKNLILMLGAALLVAAPVAKAEEMKVGYIDIQKAIQATTAGKKAKGELEKEFNVKTSYLRLRSYPFNQDLIDFVRRHDRVYIVDQNRDAQLLALMRLEFDPADIAKLRSVRYYGGLPLDARTLTEEIVRQEGL